jgi:VanZ family protein
VEPQTKPEHSLGSQGGGLVGRMLVIGALLAVTYFLGTSLFSNEHSIQLVRWVVDALRLSRPDQKITALNAGLRWTAHYLQFLVLFAAFAVWPLRLRPLTALLLCLALAAADEGHQYFLPDRSCSLTDLELDWAGTVTAFVFVLAVTRLRGRSRGAARILATAGEKAPA